MSRNCDGGFRAGAPVLARCEVVSVDTLSAGAEIWSCAGQLRRVVAVHKTTARRWIHVITRAGASMMLTQDRPLLLADGWVRAAKLIAGDRIVAFALDGFGAASTLWANARSWQGRRGKMDFRSLRDGPFPTPLLRNVARFDTVIATRLVVEAAVAFDVSLDDGVDGGFVVGGVLARAGQ